MKKSSDLRHGRHCVFKLHAHLVFVTKYRRGVLNDTMLKTIEKYFIKICNDMEATLIECDGEDDHIHLLVEYSPKLPLSKLVNSLKGASSRRMRKTFPELEKYYWKGGLWSPSYFAGSCGGASLDIIRKYIENQRVAYR